MLNLEYHPLTASEQKITTRFERKFFIRPEKIGLAYGLLRQFCRPDTLYPDNIINSLYFDTPELEQYRLSESGELRKNKVRIRWYDRADGENTPVYLELKSREGFASSKQRTRLMVPSSQLETGRLREGITDRLLLVRTLASFAYFPNRPLIPIMLVSYRRYRFNEISAGIRVSLDFEICGQAVAPAVGGLQRKVKLAGGVVEIKGAQMELPPTLRRLKILDTEWTRFSKYSNCIDACLAEPGSIAGNWPSGRTNLT